MVFVFWFGFGVLGGFFEGFFVCKCSFSTAKQEVADMEWTTLHSFPPLTYVNSVNKTDLTPVNALSKVILGHANELNCLLIDVLSLIAAPLEAAI